MHSIAFDTTSASLRAGRRRQAAALLAVPLGSMTTVGAIVFWEWSALIFVSVIALAMGAALLTGAFRVLARGDVGGARILLAAACVQVGFTIAKLAIWHETAAIPFGVVALGIVALLWRGRS